MTDSAITYTVILSSMVILLLIAGVAITIFVANKQRITQEIKMTQMQRDYEKEMRTVQHEVQEQVLTTMSQELHDNIGQLMTFMHFQLENYKLNNPEVATMLRPMRDTLSKVREEVRLISKSLSSDSLEQIGLRNSVSAEVMRLRQFKYFQVGWETDHAEPSLSKDQRLMTFRIFQEIINNMLKHAQATRIDVFMNGRGNFFLEIKDDGVGFNVDEAMKTGSGSGLKNIIKRASLADLTCTIVSEPGKGSIFTLSKVKS